jgi:hypothetical protein
MALMASNRASGGKSGRRLTTSQLGSPAFGGIGPMRTDWRAPHPGYRRATCKHSAWMKLRPFSRIRQNPLNIDSGKALRPIFRAVVGRVCSYGRAGSLRVWVAVAFASSVCAYLGPPIEKSPPPGGVLQRQGGTAYHSHRLLFGPDAQISLYNGRRGVFPQASQIFPSSRPL